MKLLNTFRRVVSINFSVEDIAATSLAVFLNHSKYQFNIKTNKQNE